MTVQSRRRARQGQYPSHQVQAQWPGYCRQRLLPGKLRSEPEISCRGRGTPERRGEEQVAGLYAQRLAEFGYITIAMDAAYQGGSGGEPRNTDKPQFRTEDVHGAADFITQYPGVDAARLGLLGICGGGGYSLAAAKVDKRFKSVATLSMFNSGRVRRNGFADYAQELPRTRRQ
jgi:fermentation-respiration switch protein FrsA (DUF1100 family)